MGTANAKAVAKASTLPHQKPLRARTVPLVEQQGMEALRVWLVRTVRLVMGAAHVLSANIVRPVTT